MSVTHCPACYARKVWCRTCKTRHCGCTWSYEKCPKYQRAKRAAKPHKCLRCGATAEWLE